LGATATSGITDTNLVGSLTVNDAPNKINIGLDNLRQALSLGSNAAAYTATIFFYYVSVNKSNVKYGSPTTYTRINSSSVAPTQANYVDLASGVISIENLVAGNGAFTSWLRTGIAGGARIELSAVTNFTDNGYTVKKGLTAYSSGSTETLGFDLSSGALSIAGSLAATSISTSSGKFTVGSGGILTAIDVDLTGLIKASSGNIGGILIVADAIQNGATSGNSTFRLDNAGKARFGSATGSAIIIEPAGNIFHTNDGTNASGKFTLSGGNLTLGGTFQQLDTGSGYIKLPTSPSDRIEFYNASYDTPGFIRVSPISSGNSGLFLKPATNAAWTAVQPKIEMYSDSAGGTLAIDSYSVSLNASSAFQIKVGSGGVSISGYGGATPATSAVMTYNYATDPSIMGFKNIQRVSTAGQPGSGEGRDGEIRVVAP